MENTNGQVRRRRPERILVAATLAAVAMLGCSDEDGGNLNPTAPSAVNEPATASSASAVATVATPTSTGADAAASGDQITVDGSMTSTPGFNAAIIGREGGLTANFALAPADHDGSPFAVLLYFSAPIDNKPRHVKQAFSVRGGTTGGSVTKAKRLDPTWQSGKKVASQWELTVTPWGSGDVVLAVPGGQSCSAGSALCTPARQSLSHDLSATIREGTAESHQTSVPGRVTGLKAIAIGGHDYLVSFGPPAFGPTPSKYHILVGGCTLRARRITVQGGANTTVQGGLKHYIRNIRAGTSTAGGGSIGTPKFGADAVNRTGTGPCTEVDTVRG